MHRRTAQIIFVANNEDSSGWRKRSLNALERLL